MTLPKELTTVTLVSRIAELIVLIAAMIISFGLGVNYQETIDLLKQQNNLTPATINKPQAPIYDLYREPIDSGTSPLSNTIGETANWKTYKNEEFRFEVMYPKDWNLKTYPREEDLLLFIGFASKPGDPSPIATFIRVRKQIAPISNPIFSLELNREWKITDGEKIVIDKQIGYYFKDYFPGPTAIDHAYIPFNGFLYELFAPIDRNNPEKYRRVFNQILSTFKFTE